MTKKKRHFINSLFAFLAIFCGLMASLASAATMQVRSGMAVPGDAITLPVEITGDVQDVYGFQLDVTAVPSSGAPVLTLGAFANGSIVTTSALVESHPATPTTQPARIGLSTVIPAPGDPRPVFDGPGAMAQLTFNVPVTAVIGQSYLINVSGVLLAGPGNQAIGVSAFGGMITVGAVTALADTISAPSSLTATEGIAEPLDVTVTGLGNMIPGVTVHFAVDNPLIASLSAATAVSDSSGVASINVTGIRDGGTIIRISAPGIPEVSVPLTVLGVTPYFISVPPLEVNQGVAYSYDAEAIDPNGDALTYSLTVAPSGMVINALTGLITWTPALGQPQTGNDVTVSVSDPGGHTDTQSFSIFIVVDNDSDGYDNRYDCNDADATVNPGAVEVPYDGKDNDCNSATPDDDLDGDGYIQANDCDDANPAAHPGAPEILYNGIDDDCDPNTKDGSIDADGDGYGDMADCNESDPTINPGRVEIRHNGKDDDCNAGTPDNWANTFVIAIDDSSWIYYAKSNGNGTFSNYRSVWQLGGCCSRGVVIEDFDGDGDLDFIAGRGNGSTAYYYLFKNDGADNFKDIRMIGDLYNANYWAMDMAAGDFNNDGRMDFVANGNYINTGIYLNDGMGGFTKTIFNLPNSYYGRGIDAADFNADGNLDLAMGTYPNGEVRVYFGDGTGSFTSTPIGNVGNDLYALAAADFDKDGKTDIIAGGSYSGDPYFFKGNGDGTFQTPVYVASLDMNYHNAIDAYDFNGDGNTDIVLSDTNVYMWFYPGNGDGTFGARTQVTTSNARTTLLAVAAPPSGNPAGFPVADAEPQAQALSVGDVANLNGTYSFDPDGTITSYDWKFDDGGTGSGEIVSHAYTSEDLFTPALTVTDNDGKKDSASAEVFVFGNPPVADAGGPYVLGEANASNGRYTVTLNGSGSSDDYGIMKYEWDMGAGFEDNFDDGNADGWGPTNGTWGVSAGVYNQSNEGVDRSDTFAGDPKLGDYTIEADIQWVSGWGQEAMILFRGLDQNNHYEFILRGRGANDLLLARVQNGGWTQIGYFQLPFAPQLNSWYHLKVEAYGSSIRCYLDGSLIIDVADSGLTNGKVGFSTYYTNARFDNLMVYARRTGVSPTHLFSAGAHTVALTVTDRVGQTDTDTAQVTATAGAPPVSNPGGPYTFGETFANSGIWTVGLTGSGSTDDVAIESYAWTFGDGGTGTGVNPSHGYTNPGVYNVSLTVTDRAGQSNTVSTTVTILAGALPVANPGGPYTVLESQVVNKHWTIAADGTGSSDDVNIWKYEWTFGDNTSATTATVNHTYANPGTYTVTLTVTDHAKQTHTVTTTASITGEGLPVADAGGPYLAEKGYPVTFDGSGSTDDFGILSYQWNFGDGTTGSGAQPAHTYGAEGNYTATLMVRDMALQEVTDTAAVNVTVGNPPVADPGGPYTTNEDLPIRFDGSHSTDDYGIVSYEWVIGETTTLLQDTFDGTTLNAAKWLYPSSGVTQNNVVTITGGGGWGARYLFSQDNFTVSGGTELQGQINQTSSGYHHLMFGFKNTGSNYSYEQMPYAIYFAAGGLQVYESGGGRGQFATYSVNTPYDVKIVLKGAAGSSPTGATYYYKPATSTTWITLYDSNHNPGYAAMKVGLSYYDGTYLLDNVSLTSGGIKLTGERPVGIFTQAGTYPAMLKVTDGAGQSHSASTTLTVSADPAVITVPWQFSGGIEVPHDTWSGEEVIFKAVVKSKHGPLTYSWEFGDGASASGTVTNLYDVSTRHTYTAAAGTPFVARLTVTDSNGLTASDTFPVIIREKTLDVEINKAIDDGLWFVHVNQNHDSGRWVGVGSYGAGWITAPTASSIHAMEINGHLEVGDFSQDPYVEDVWKGLAFLLTTIRQYAIGDQPYGNPDVNANGIGIEVSEGQPIYQGGQVMMALVASGTPEMVAVTGGAGIRGRTYREVVEDMAEMYYWGQADGASGYSAGGWHYGWQYASGDNSASQWAALGMDAAEEVGWIQVPRWVKDRNQFWLAYSQHSSGEGYGYNGPNQCVDGQNCAATSPSGLAQVAFDDIPTTDLRWKNIENALARNWDSMYNGTGNYYALYALAKAMRIARPNEIIIMGEGTQYAIDWYNDNTRGVARTIVNQQDANGQFVGGYGWRLVEDAFRTAWGVIILTKSLFVLPPVADAGDNRVWGVDWELTFDGSRSYHLDPFRQIVSYEWDFDGNGTYDSSSPDPTATHTYTELGTYNVTLRVRDNNDPAKYDTDTVTVIVAVPPHPPVAEPGGPYTGNVGIPVSLNGSASYDIDPTDVITQYGWELDGVFPYDFDDLMGATPSFTWNAPGNYNIGLRVLDNGVLNDLNGNGQVDEDEKLPDIRWTTVNIVANHAPVADAGGPYAVNEGSSIALDGSGSSDPDENPITYAWDLDNDSQYDDATGVNPSFSGLEDGTYTVGLEVSDGSLSGTDTATVTVANVVPSVNAGTDQTVNEGDTVNFSGSFTDPGTLDTHTIHWDFGDGATADATLTPSHVYADNGVYTATLTVTDDDGGVGSDSAVVTVNNVAPTVDAGSDQVVDEGDIVNFSGSFTDPGTPDTHTIHWDFGDGGTADGTLTPSHAYANDGSYTVTLTVTDDDGGAGSDTLQVTANPVIVNRAPVADAGGPYTVDEGSSVALDGSASFDPDGDPITYAWDLDNDGQYDDATLVNPQFGRTDNGVFTVGLEVSDGSLTGTDTATVTIRNVAPLVDAGMDHTVNEGDLHVHIVAFTDVGTSDTHTGTVNWGDGSPDEALVITEANGSGSASPSHLYRDNGDYTATFTICDDDGDCSADTAMMHVLNLPPLVNAGTDQAINAGQTAAFSGSFTDPGTSDTHTIHWDFGDGGTADGTLTPAHQYLAAGDYTVTLTVTDDDGDSGTDTLTVTVNPVAQPVQTIFDLTARAKDRKIDIVWTCVPGNVTYNIYRSTTQGGPYTQVMSGHTSSYCTYADFGLVNGTTYYYRVTSVDESGLESLYSNEASGKPVALIRLR